MTNRDQLLLGSIWNRKKEPECCPCPPISEDGGNILECRNDGMYASLSAPTQFHGNTALVSKNGDDTTAAASFITLSPSGRAWNWNLPFLTISAAVTAAVEPSTIIVESGTYSAVTLNKNITIQGNPGVVIPTITATTTNKIVNVVGKINLTPNTNTPALWIDNGVTGTFDLGNVVGDCGVFFRGRAGQTSYLNADSIVITEDNGFLNACIHNGAIGHGATLYANVQYISMDGTNSPIPNSVVGVISRGGFANTYITSKVIRSNCGPTIEGDGIYHGTVCANIGGKLHVKADLILNYGTGRAVATGNNAADTIYLDCSEIRVTSTTIEAMIIQAAGSTIYMKSGCRVIAGSSATYAVTGSGNLFIDGTVYSNKPLDPAVQLLSGTWVVDANIV